MSFALWQQQLQREQQPKDVVVLQTVAALVPAIQTVSLELDRDVWAQEMITTAPYLCRLPE